MLLAAEDGITTADLGYRRDRSMAIALSPRLAHNTGANGIFTALAAAARASGGQQALECWWGERRCAAAWGDHARPDGYGRWSEQAPGQPPAAVDFFLEYDTGTEPLSRVVAKLAGYAALAARTGITTPVLFWLREPEPGGRAARPAGRRRRPASVTPPRPRRSPASRSRPPLAAPAAKARPGRPGCPPPAPARGSGSPSSPRPAPPRPTAARPTMDRAARPAAWPGTRRSPPRPPGTP